MVSGLLILSLAYHKNELWGNFPFKTTSYFAACFREMYPFSYCRLLGLYINSQSWTLVFLKLAFGLSLKNAKDPALSPSRVSTVLGGKKKKASFTTIVSSYYFKEILKEKYYLLMEKNIGWFILNTENKNRHLCCSTWYYACCSETETTRNLIE